jgi:hypothetical protein
MQTTLIIIIIIIVKVRQKHERAQEEGNWKRIVMTITNSKTNFVALSPRANYTDWATATCWWSLVPTLADRGVSRGQRSGSPTEPLLFFQVAPHLLMTIVIIIIIIIGTNPVHITASYPKSILLFSIQLWLRLHSVHIPSAFIFHIHSCNILCQSYVSWFDHCNYVREQVMNLLITQRSRISCYFITLRPNVLLISVFPL